MYPGTHAARTPDKPAVVMAGTGQVVTYHELDRASTRLAVAFRRAGLEVGDRVAIAMDNDAHYLTVCWAARRAGLYYVPINWHLTADEMAHVVDDSGARALVANQACAEAALDLRDRCPRVGWCVSVGASIPGFVGFEEIVAQAPSITLDELEGDDIIYTSGTTGLPKGGVRPLSGRHPANGSISPLMRDLYRIDEDTRYLMPGAPMYHGAPLRFTLGVTQLGGTNVIMERFDAAAALAAIERHGVTHSQWVPTMFIRLLRLDPQVRGGHDLSTHRLAIHSAAPCPPSVKGDMIEWWGPILFEFYGASEGGVITALTSEEWLAHRGSVGRAVHGAVHILDEDGVELPAGEIGLVYGEGGRPIEYLGDPAKTAAAHSAQGWATAGDLGHLDDEGYLYLSSRRSDLIIAGGVNIYPQEVEDVLAARSEVADVAVIGVPHDELGEEVKAVVVPSDGHIADATLADVLIEHCRAHLARYKCPRSVDFVIQLPRTPSGKLYKRRLRAHYWPDEESEAPCPT